MSIDDAENTAEISADQKEIQELKSKLLAYEQRDQLDAFLKPHAPNFKADLPVLRKLIQEDVRFDRYGFVENGAAVIERLRNQYPFLTQDGAQEATPAATTPNVSVSTAEEVDDAALRKLFGPTSDSKLASKVAKADMGRYKRLRELAKSKGLIG